MKMMCFKTTATFEFKKGKNIIVEEFMWKILFGLSSELN